MRSQQGPLQASIDERSEELTELVGMLAKALRRISCKAEVLQNEVLMPILEETHAGGIRCTHENAFLSFFHFS